nr:SpvB/TcaC N-terminal domain-containing protein [Spirochaetaceae bacterium]
MDIIKKTLLILLINSILFFQTVPLYALQTDNLYYDQLLSHPVENISYSEVVYKDRANTIIFDDVTLDISLNALNEDTLITMDKLFYTKGLNTGMANVTQGAAAYRFGPVGMKFNSKIKITIPFDPKIARSETALSNLYTWFYNEELRKWEKLERFYIDRENFTITSLTDHFTDMINSTLQLPEGPSPINFNPNSIKELKAADPGAEIPGISGLEPSRTGGADLSIPMRIPKGRGGATPSLALSYNSEFINGWMGRGFNIPTPSITTDTRFGLPEYERNDTYMYKGEELIPLSTSGNRTLYKPRKDSSFEQIFRLSESGEPDFWEVSDKSGMVYTYGKDEGWLGPVRGNKSKVYTWYLTGIKDANGNTVTYLYKYDADNYYTYLDSIVYSGYEGAGPSEAGKYKIEFVRETDPNLLRRDRKIDLRGKFPSKLVDLLKSVRVLYDKKLIRTYQFSYDTNEFGQTQLHSYSEYDKDNTKFYTYDFEYHKLPENENGGYDGFGKDTLQWNTSFDNLSTSISGNGGASLALGVSFRIFGRTIAGVNVRGGYNYTGGMNKALMTDINGDGLPDFIETSSKNLGTFLNNGSGFDNTFLSFGGLSSNLNVTGQNSLTIGAGASLGPGSASYTKQLSWPFAKTMLADFNGDGFVDQLEKGSDSFRMNNGTSFEKVPLIFDNSGSVAPLVSSPGEIEEEESFKRAFYREDPLTRWTSVAAGTVKVKQTIQAQSAEISKDGLNCRTYFKDQKESVKLSQAGEEFESSVPNSYSVSENDNIYFHLDPGEKEKGDDVSWKNNIRYTEIDLLEKMDLVSQIHIPDRINFTLPFEELSDIYDRHLDDSGDTPYSYYTPKKNWINYINSTLYQKLFLNNMFNPKVLTLDQYKRMKDQSFLGFDPVLFLKGYEYFVKKGIFVRKNSLSDSQVQNNLNLLTDSEKLNCSGFLWFDENVFQPAFTDTTIFIKDNTSLLDSRLYSSDQLTAPGRMDINGNIFVETINTLGGGALDIRYDGSDINYPNGISKNETPLSLKFNTDLNGYHYSVLFSGKEHLIQNISREVYEGNIKDLVLGSKDINLKDFRVIEPFLYDQMLTEFNAENYKFYREGFLSHNFNEISDSLYNQLLLTMTAEELLIFQTLYSLNAAGTGNYDINPVITEENILLILEKIYDLT